MCYRIALNFEDGITRFVDCKPGEKVLDAAFRNKINLPMDCSDGVCGTCKCRAESGAYDMGDDYIDDALTEDEAAEGYILTCQTKPYTDMVVQIATTSVLAKTGASTLIGTITELERLSESTVKFAVQIEDRETLTRLVGLGCDRAQGFLFGHPLPIDELCEAMRTDRFGHEGQGSVLFGHDRP